MKKIDEFENSAQYSKQKERRICALWRMGMILALALFLVTPTYAFNLTQVRYDHIFNGHCEGGNNLHGDQFVQGLAICADRAASEVYINSLQIAIADCVQQPSTRYKCTKLVPGIAIGTGNPAQHTMILILEQNQDDIVSAWPN